MGDGFQIALIIMMIISFVGVVAEKDKGFRLFLLATFITSVVAFIVFTYMN